MPRPNSSPFSIGIVVLLTSCSSVPGRNESLSSFSPPAINMTGMTAGRYHFQTMRICLSNGVRILGATPNVAWCEVKTLQSGKLLTLSIKALPGAPEGTSIIPISFEFSSPSVVRWHVVQQIATSIKSKFVIKPQLFWLTCPTRGSSPQALLDLSWRSGDRPEVSCKSGSVRLLAVLTGKNTVVYRVFYERRGGPVYLNLPDILVSFKNEVPFSIPVRGYAGR